LGAFVEILHNASLMIDDIEDNSVKRRGQDCCHVKFGVPVAISAGNSLYFLAMNWVLRQSDEAVRAKLLEAAVTEMTNLHLGQNQDIVWNRDLVGPDTQYSEDGYLTLCRTNILRLL
jgi:geranylgeranyl pyrophosphate synthase